MINHAINMEPVTQAIENTWGEYQKKFRWPLRKIKIPKNIINATAKGQQNVEGITEDIPKGFSLQENIRKIASQWDWKRSPAPLQLLQSQRYWEGILNNLKIQIQETEETKKEALESVIKWTKNQISSRKQEWESLEGETGRIVLRRILKETQQAAHALGKLEDLTSHQKMEWEKTLLEIIQPDQKKS